MAQGFNGYSAEFREISNFNFSVHNLTLSFVELRNVWITEAKVEPAVGDESNDSQSLTFAI